MVTGLLVILVCILILLLIHLIGPGDSVDEMARREASYYDPKVQANGEDIIEITVTNGEAVLTVPTANSRWEWEQTGVLNFFKNTLESKNLRFSGSFVIGLHDSYPEDLGIMVFSKPTDYQKNTLLPDFYSMRDYDGKLNMVDPHEFSNKKGHAIFAGSSTGNLDPKLNDRLRLCEWARTSADVDCFILNNFVQLDIDQVSRAFPKYNEFARDRVEPSEQLQNKFIISVDGNATAWDRVPWVLNSNSVLLKKRSDQVSWYYPFMKKGEHYLEFDNFDDIESLVRTPDHICETILKNSSNFVNQYLRPDAHMDYMSKVLYYSSMK